MDARSLRHEGLRRVYARIAAAERDLREASRMAAGLGLDLAVLIQRPIDAAADAAETAEVVVRRALRRAEGAYSEEG